MQTLWTRALQVKSSCRCPSCVAHPRKALSRRVGTAPTIRYPQPVEVLSTLAFSTTIAAGAALDARSKRLRREELEGSLNRAQDELRALDDEHTKRLAALGLDDNGKPLEDDGTQTQSLLSSAVVERQNARMVDRTSTPESTSRYVTTSMQTARGGSRVKESLEIPAEENEIHTSQSVSWLSSQSSSTASPQPPQEADVEVDTIERRLPGQDGQVGEEQKATKKNRSNSKVSVTIPLRRVPVEIDNDGMTVPGVRRNKREKKKARDLTRNSWSGYYDSPTDVSTSYGELFFHIFDEMPTDLRVGLSPEECWMRPASGKMSHHIILSRQLAVSTMIHRIVLDRARKVGSFEAMFPNTGIRVFEKSDQALLLDTIQELTGARHRLLRAATKSESLAEEVASLPLPEYQWISDIREPRRSTLQEQNDHLMKFFATPMSPEDRLSDLCSLLAHQREAPNVHTFNILLIKLSQLQLHKTAKRVVEAILELNVHKNSVTHVAILDCYQNTNDPTGFYEYLSRMDCKTGRGLRRNRGKDSHSHPFEVLSKPVYEGSAHAVNEFEDLHKPPAALYNSVPRTLEIYEATIGGLLRFNNLRKALQEYTRMTRSGIRPTIDIYKSFVRYCLLHKAWSLAWALWTKMLENPQQMDTEICYWMLQTACRCEKPADYKAILKTCANYGFLPRYSDRRLCSNLTEREFIKVFEYSDAIQALKTKSSLQIPGDSVSQPYQLKYTSEWPANLYTFVEEQLKTLIAWNYDSQGHCVDMNGEDISASELNEGGQDTWWMTILNQDGHMKVDKRPHEKLVAPQAQAPPHPEGEMYSQAQGYDDDGAPEDLLEASYG